MISPTFFERWVWPAGGSGGIPGDVVGTLVWVVIAAVIGAVVWPPTREALKRFAQSHANEIKKHVASENADLHRKLDRSIALGEHIIKHSPHVPELPE